MYICLSIPCMPKPTAPLAAPSKGYDYKGYVYKRCILNLEKDIICLKGISCNWFICRFYNWFICGYSCLIYTICGSSWLLGYA